MKKFLFLTLLLSAIGLQGWADKYPNVLYAVGSATSTNWDIGAASKLYKYADSNKYQGFVSFESSEGELKFLCTTSFDEDIWGPETNGTSVNSAGTVDIRYTSNSGSGNDKKFKPTFATGLYLVTIDATTEGSETVTFKLWNNSTDVYEIGNAAQLHAFANCVNNFCTTMKGKLTADIDMTGEGWTPIGGEGHKYCGTFDGQGHMIDHLVLDNSGYDSQGIFGQVGGSIDADECIIKNLIAGPNNSIKGAKYVGGLIGCADGNGTIKLINCGQEGYVEAVNENAAAMIGCMKSCALYLENCYNIGNIKGGKESAIISGWLAGHKYHTISGFYNTGSIEYGQDGDHSLFRNQDENNNWADIPYTDFTKYENVYHIYEDQGAKKVDKDADDYYQIGDGQKLKWFAYLTRTNTTAKGKLTANIDMSGIEYPGIGTSSNCYRGIFDGQKHIIRNLKMHIEDNAVGFFRFITSGGTVIKRFTIDSSCSFSGNNGVGAFVGRAVGRNGDRDILFEELGNEADVTASGSNGSGILGVNQGSDAYITMKNCYNTGAISSDQEGGALSGWLGDKTKVINCYNMGAITNGEGLARANSDKVASLNLFSTVDTSTLQITGTQKTSTDFQNGTVFAALFGYTNADPAVDGSVWRMDYDADTPHPVLYGNSIAMREDCQNTLPSKEMTGMSVTLYRTLTSGTWNSICLPFDLDADGIEEVFGEGTKVAEFASVNGVNNDNLHFGQVTSISARTPYLIYPANDRDIDTPIVLSGITIQPSPATVTEGGFNFTGIYSPTSITGKYFIASGNTIKKSTGGNLKGFRAYIESVAEARPLTFDFFDDVTTGVKDAKHLMNSGLLTTDNVYDLQGRRIANPTKGLYVVNGKKVVIK